MKTLINKYHPVWPTTTIPCTRTPLDRAPLWRRTLLSSLLAAAMLPLLLLNSSTGLAASATWRRTPNSGDWNTATNWMPSTVPNGSADTATFGFSDITDISLSEFTVANGIIFTAGASAFTITSNTNFGDLIFTGVGITNNSGIAQNFTATVAGNQSGMMQFQANARAGSMTFFTNNGSLDGPNGGETDFFASSTADHGTFTNNDGGTTNFLFAVESRII